MTLDELLKLPQREAKAAIYQIEDPERYQLATAYSEERGIWLLTGKDVVDRPHGDSSSEVTTGAWIVGLGVIAAIGSFFFPVGVDVGYGVDQVANIDRIALRHMLLNASLVAVVCGFVLIAAGTIKKAVTAK